MPEHIVIGDIRPRVQYVADGTQSVFTYPFPIFADADLKVYFGEALQGAGYAVSGAGQSAGGSVTFASPPAAGARVTLLRALAIARATDFQEGGAFRAKTLNDELDRQTAFIQEVGERIERAIVAAPTESAAPLVLPPPAARANALLGFDAAGAPIASAGAAGILISAAMMPVVQAASLADGRTAQGLGTAATKDTGTAPTDVPLGADTLWARVPERSTAVGDSVVSTDRGKLVKCTAALTLDADASALGADFVFGVQATGNFTVTVADTTAAANFYGPDGNAAETISVAPGATGSKTLWLKSDGTNWYVIAEAKPAVPGVSVALIRDEKPNGTNGGSAAATTWNARDLNTEVSDPDGIVAIGANMFLPAAGTYVAIIDTPQLATGISKQRLYNNTAAAVVSNGGAAQGLNNSISERATLRGTYVFIANGTDSYRVDSYSETARATDGLGEDDNIADGNEIYTQILLTKVA